MSQGALSTRMKYWVSLQIEQIGRDPPTRGTMVVEFWNQKENKIANLIYLFLNICSLTTRFMVWQNHFLSHIGV
jgi:hypothetical protein